jgi:magnesium-transporting ATPase (P-type)
MQPNIPDPNVRFCYKCHYRASVSDGRCPRCGGSLKTKANIRLLGGVLVFLGGFISVIMLGVMVLMFGIFAQAPASKMRGEEGKALMAVAIVAAVFAIGASFAIAGLWQIIFAKRNKWIVWASIGLVVLVLIAGRIFRALT